ncbi:MAG: DNA polymerase III subunit beta [Nitrospirae bacterium]|nr:DNA polymerase III subunit beta [Nitrospirota bacterium]
MEFSIEQGVFLEGLEKVSILSDRKNIALLASHILIEAGEDEITLVSFDQSAGGRLRLPAKVTVPGQTTVLGKKLFQIVRELSPGPVRLSKDPSDRKAMTTLEKDRAVFHLKGIDPRDFASFPEIAPEYSFGLPLRELLRLLQRTLPFVEDEEKDYMNGVLFQREREPGGRTTLNVVGTDGSGLHHGQIPLGEEGGIDLAEQGQKRFLVKRRHIADLVRILETDAKDEKLTVDISVNPRYALFRWLGFYFFVRLLDLRYPNYRDVFPEDHSVTIDMSRDAFASMLKRASLISDRNLEVEMLWNDRTVTVKSQNLDIGDSREESPAIVNGPESSFFFSLESLSKLLGVVGGVTLRMQAIISSDPEENNRVPVIWSSLEEPQSRYVIMPLGAES